MMVQVIFSQSSIYTLTKYDNVRNFNSTKNNLTFHLLHHLQELASMFYVEELFVI